MSVGTHINNYQTASAGISNLYNGNYYEAGQIYGYAQGEAHLQLGLMVATAGVVKGVSVPRAGATNWNGFQKMTAGQFTSRAEAATAWSKYKSVTE